MEFTSLLLSSYTTFSQKWVTELRNLYKGIYFTFYVNITMCLILTLFSLSFISCELYLVFAEDKGLQAGNDS